MINSAVIKRVAPEYLETFRAYRKLFKEVWTKGEHPWQRMSLSRDLEPVEVLECIPYEDPYDPEATSPVLHPSPRFITELMYGGIHPPIEAQLAQKLLIIPENGAPAVVSKLEAPEFRAKNGPIKGEYVVDNTRNLTEVEGPLTYEEAIEYCIMKDIPHAVWRTDNNRLKFAVVPKDTLPTRKYRNAWKFNEELPMAA